MPVVASMADPASKSTAVAPACQPRAGRGAVGPREARVSAEAAQHLAYTPSAGRCCRCSWATCARTGGAGH